MRILRFVLFGVLGLILLVGIIFGAIALGRVIFNTQTVACPEVTPVEFEPSLPVSVSCVVRMQPGETAEVFTETWDSERRVWVHLDSGVCEGPYCFSYDACHDALETLKIQPFWTGHELSPVDNKPFLVCYNFNGDCAR